MRDTFQGKQGLLAHFSRERIMVKAFEKEDMGHPREAKGPLKGMRVLDLGLAGAGPRARPPGRVGS